MTPTSAGTARSRGQPLSFEEFRAVLADAVARRLSEVPPTARLLGDLALDEIELCRLHLVVEELNPYFELPDHSDVDFLTLGDIHFYYRWMDAGNVAEGP